MASPLTSRESPKRRKTIAVLVDYIDFVCGGYETQTRRVFHRVCSNLDINLLLVAGRAINDPTRGSQGHNAIYRCLDRERVDGVIVLSANLASYGGLEPIHALCRDLKQLPLVSMGLSIPNIPSVVIDNNPGMAELVAHLIRVHRCHRLGFIAGLPNNPDADARLATFRHVLECHDIAFDPNLVVGGQFVWRGGYLAAKELLQRATDLDGVVAANDGMAFGALVALQELGVRVPMSLRVTGFDDLVMARLGTPTLTTVRQPLEAMAETAVRLTLEQMEGRSVADCTTLPAEFIARDSCGCSVVTRSQTSCPTCNAAERAVEHLQVHRQSLVLLLTGLQPSLQSSDTASSSDLVDALRAELAGNAGTFISQVRTIVECIGNSHERYPELQAVITILRNELSPTMTPELEDLWHDARTFVALANARAHAQERQEFNEFGFGLVELGDRLSVALDIDTLRDSLIQCLPRTGIDNAFVSLYDSEQTGLLLPWLCLLNGRAHSVQIENFAERLLYPPGGYADQRRHTSMVFPLVFEAKRQGIAVFEYRPGIHGYPMLRDQISSALRTVELHEEVVLQVQLRERSVQERMATVQRMESLGILAGGVAHDLNNSLGALVALPDVILSTLNDESMAHIPGMTDLRADVESIKVAALRSTQTIKDLLTLGRQGKTSKEVIDLNAVVSAVMTSATIRTARSRSPRMTLSFDPHHQPLVVHASEAHLSRAVTNLVRNAMDAIPDRGCVTVKTLPLAVTAPTVGYESIEPGEYAVVRVSDNGTGIAPAEMARVFEPFFTKKRLGDQSGSGLGLAIVHSVIKEHEGFVDVQSVVGQGTIFTLYFPKAQQELKPVLEPSHRPAGAGRILVVDDDPIQLRTARRVLVQLGYDVVTVGSGIQAVELFKGRDADPTLPSPFDLVILDLFLNEELDGLAVAKGIAALAPCQRTIIASGQMPTQEHWSDSGERINWLPKPYTFGTLARTVSEVLHQPAV
jgi:DNA-binding LacI/PurR family transcriptional regulator/signal transduction histidine kinase/CheY-like chemotaxis protein